MVSSSAEVTDDSATISNGEDPSVDTNSDAVTDANDEAFESLSPSDFTSFLEGEKVFAYHKQQLYEAKVLRVESRTNARNYYVHYLGWSKKWDEWIPIDRLLKFTEENMHKKQLLDKNLEPKRGLSVKPKHSVGSAAQGKKRKNDEALKEKGTVLGEKPFNIQIPLTLKKQLVNDCENVNHFGKLVKLPRSPTIDDILKEYTEYRLKKDNKIADSVEEILSGLCCYFNKALPAMLLYKSERSQYQETIGENVSPSSMYGAEHLLRLFVKLPELLHSANIEEETLAELQQILMDFLRFLQKNHSSFFLPTHGTTLNFDVEED